MSRVMMFDLSNHSVGEFTAEANRGWGLSGKRTLAGGLQTTLAIPASVASQDWLQFGRMALIQDSKLPAWCGVMDTPWSGKIPSEAIFYGPEYLLDLRMPDRQAVLSGSFESILIDLIGLINQDEDLFVRAGILGELPAGQQQLTIDQKSLWVQLNDFGKREGVEFFFRATREQNEPLTIYIDAGQRIGMDTGILLHDGARANMQVTSASVTGIIRNRVIGIGKADSAQKRPQTAPYRDEDSIDRYRMRSAVVQFSTLTDLSSLETATQKSLDASARPRLKLVLSLMDNDDLFTSLSPGNSFMVHAAEIYLPGGVKGWRGQMRMLQMALDDHTRTVSCEMEAWL